jgi:hypothetical protein
VRKEKALPLLESLNALASALVRQAAAWKLGETLVYLRNQSPNLIRCVDGEKVAIDTNLAENAIRRWFHYADHVLAPMSVGDTPPALICGPLTILVATKARSSQFA